MNQKDHWEQVYSTKLTEKVGWYKRHLQTSLDWTKELSLAAGAPIIDVGGGASTLVDDLLGAGYRSITVLDISEEALCSVKERLGKKAKMVTWLNGDITSVVLPGEQYRETLLKAIKPRGHLIIGTFTSEAPPKCSGLPVQRYNLEQLQDSLGPEFKLVRHRKEKHVTPGGLEQMYLYCCFRRTA